MLPFLGRNEPWPRCRKVVRVAYKCKSLAVLGERADGHFVTMPLYCRRWQCPDCGKHQRRRLKRRLISGRPTTFITLTTNPKAHPDREEAFRDASLNINRLMKVLRRRYSAIRIQYALVWELTKQGYPHAHILLRAPYIPQKFLSREWQRLSGADIVDIRQIRTENQAAAYVSKYLTKDPATPYGAKRYRTSRQYSDAIPRGQLTARMEVTRWLRVHAPLSEALISLNDHGHDVWEHLPDLWCSWPPPPP